MLTCPTCRCRLLHAKGPAGVFYVCPRCGGRAVGIAVIRRGVGRDCVKDLWLQSQAARLPAGKKCPVCQRWMRGVTVTAGQRPLQLDLCRSCQVVWFDPSEFEQLPTAPMPAPAEELSPRAREQLALERVKIEARRAEGQGTTDEEPIPQSPWSWIPGVLGLPVEEEVEPLRSLPWATWTLAAMLVLVFLATMRNLEQAILQYGLVPNDLMQGRLITLLTSFFLHADFWHLLGNVYFLLVFGDNVEDCLGRPRFVALLALAALAGDAAHLALEPRWDIPAVGASAGISGVIVFYALRFPHARLGVLLRYWYLYRWLFLPAWAALVLWIMLQLVMAGLETMGASPVAAFAHLGGAAAGLLAWAVWRNRM